VLAALVLVALVAGWQHYGNRVWLPLETVRFSGELRHVERQDLRAAVGPELSGGLFTIDVAGVRRRVEALPWIASASVRRVWPQALRIDVTEHKPVAAWGEGALIHDAATVIRPPQRPAELPALSGPEGTADRVLAVFRRLAERLAPLGLIVTGLHLDARRAWQAELQGGGKLLLGRDDLGQRLSRLTAAWPRITQDGRAPARIDLRYPNGFALRWQPSETPGQAEAEGLSDDT